MTILALEFSSPQRSAAVLRTDGTVTTAEVVDTGGRGTNAFGMIERALAQAKIEREQIELITVGLGPGSYTGIRAAISVAQGWQLARGVKFTGIGSVECLAAQAQAEKIFGRVNVVVDAQRNEIYLAGYHVSADGWREIEPLKICPPTNIPSPARADRPSQKSSGSASARPALFIGPEVTRWFPNGRVIYPRAAMLAQLASRRNEFVPGEKLEPIYLRETSFVKAPPSRIIAV